MKTKAIPMPTKILLMALIKASLAREPTPFKPPAETCLVEATLVQSSN